jgi:hypothetical protein
VPGTKAKQETNKSAAQQITTNNTAEITKTGQRNKYAEQQK